MALTETHRRELRRLLHAALADGAVAPAVAARFGSALDRLHPARPTGPGNRLPVARWWSDALRHAPSRWRPLLSALGPALAWTRNPNYRGRPDPVFLGRYGYGVIVGPADPRARPLVADPAVAAGLLMLGPGIEYPRHRHPAEEIYIPLSGTAWWQRGVAPWRRVPPGVAIHHPPFMPHATRTGGTPLVALYLWRGEIASHARLSGR